MNVTAAQGGKHSLARGLEEHSMYGVNLVLLREYRKSA